MTFLQVRCPNAFAASRRTTQLESCKESCSSLSESGSRSAPSSEAETARAGADLSLENCSTATRPREKGPRNALDASLIPVQANALGSCNFLLAYSNPDLMVPSEGELLPSSTSRSTERPLWSPNAHRAFAVSKRTCVEGSS